MVSTVGDGGAAKEGRADVEAKGSEEGVSENGLAQGSASACGEDQDGTAAAVVDCDSIRAKASSSSIAVARLRRERLGIRDARKSELSSVKGVSNSKGSWNGR